MKSFFSFLDIFGNEEGRITAEELLEMMGRKDELTIIDVREPGEFRSGHIPGSVLVPLGALQGPKPVPYKGKLVVYCAAGVRSRQARALLGAKGIADVVDLKGGIKAWMRAGGEIVR